MSEHRHPDPLLRTLDAPLRAVFHPLGFPLELETNDPRVLDCAESSFGAFREADFHFAPVRLRFLKAPDSAARPPWPAAAYRAWGSLFAIVCGPQNFVSGDLDRGEAMGFFSPAMLDDSEFFRWTFLDCVTYMVLERHHVTAIHAACVVRNGIGICLCGPAGAGKTSLAYSCVRSGYQILAEDVVFLNRSGRAPALCGNAARLHFPLSARELFPELVQVPIGIRHDGEEFIVLVTAQKFPGRTVTSAEPGPIVFLDRMPDSQREALIEPVSSSEANRLLIYNLPLVDEPDLMSQHYSAIERLTRNGAYHLRYSTLAQAHQQLDTLAVVQRIQR
jgi:hypothetical protein